MAYPYFQSQGFQQAMMQQPQIQPTQIQNGGFMVVPSEEIARTYPVAPGNCVTFKIEGKPIVMEKSMGFSQLEAPRIEKYRLVREESEPVAPVAEPEVEQAPVDPELLEEVRSDIQTLRDELNSLRGDVDVLKEQNSKSTTTKGKSGRGGEHNE